MRLERDSIRKFRAIFCSADRNLRGLIVNRDCLIPGLLDPRRRVSGLRENNIDERQIP